MKNLPDKIYLNLGDLTEEEYKELDFKNLSEVTWSEDDVQGMNEEYVRTDAFIEKAWEFLKNAGFYYHYDPIEDNEWYDGEQFIEDFKKYIEK